MDLLTKPLMAWSMLDVLAFAGLVVVCLVVYWFVRVVIIAAVEARKGKRE